MLLPVFTFLISLACFGKLGLSFPLTFVLTSIFMIVAVTQRFVLNFLLWYLDIEQDGYCYATCFRTDVAKTVACAWLGSRPSVLELEHFHLWYYGVAFNEKYWLEHNGSCYHVRRLGDIGSSVTPLSESIGEWVGADTPIPPEVVEFATRAYEASRQVPTTNDIRGKIDRLLNPLALEAYYPRLPRFAGPTSHRLIAGDPDARASSPLKRKLRGVSAMESAKSLLSGMEVLGPLETRMDMAIDTLVEGVATAVAPGNPNFSKLVGMLGPLQYRPQIEAHPEAATIRRAALDNAMHVLRGAIVGLISPSNAELHAFPMAVVWEYTDALDVARRAKHCTLCQTPRCQQLSQAKNAGRYYAGNCLVAAAKLFLRFETSSLVLMNIEPNINALDLTQLMVDSGVYNAMSLTTVDWRVLLGRRVHDPLIDMTTEMSNAQVVSSFQDGGDYVQSVRNVKQMFAPTFAAGHSLRRTIIFGDGASQWFDITLSRGGWATRCVPNYDKYYFIPLVLPDMTRPLVLVEKKAGDRVIATYRTQAVKDPLVAKVVLRQSVVTYSISGTQVTPRMALSATEAEALANWLIVYSEVQDSMGEHHTAEMRPATLTAAAKKTLYGAVTDKFTATAVGAMTLGSASSVDAILRAYRTDMGESTLDQISDRAMREHFGEKVDPLSLQNALISRWRSLCGWVISPTKWVDALTKKFHDSWNVTFGYVDLIAISSLLGMRFCLETMRVFADCALTVGRMTGKQEAVKKITAFIDYLDWPTTKATRFWVGLQNAQGLDFQAATIDIVETFFNTFGVDHAADIQRAREMDLVPEDVIVALEAEAALPFSDFLSEIKLFLGKFNCHAQRAAMSATLLNAFHHDSRHVSAEQKAKMVHLFKQEMVVVKAALKEEMAFALTGSSPNLLPIPLRPIDNNHIREAFDSGSISIPSASGEITITRLIETNGVYDFSPIHTLMDLQHGDEINQANVRGPNYISPDARGARLQESLLLHVANTGNGAMLCPQNKMLPWLTWQLAHPTIEPVSKILVRATPLFQQDNVSNWLAHVTGLAYGGKSKGLRSFMSSQDLVVVPTNELKLEWQANLGKLDPVMRATVVTQHEALVTKYASRFVFIDECYAYDPEHLQAICNRHSRSKGVITVGDKRQIGNVFYPEALGERFSLPVGEAPCVMVTPTTFMPWDAAVVFINETETDTPIENYFVGSSVKEGLLYTVNSDVLIPGEGDIAMQGTQIGKEMTNARGIKCNTVHECQGRRAQHAIVHTTGPTLTRDMYWLTRPEQRSHMGVLISRAGKGTIFVVEGVEAFRNFTWYDETSVNGELPNTALYGGTSWDLVEPRMESESTWEHLVDKRIVENGLVETPLTDPVTIATVFTASGEPISSSEIHTNVELVDGVTFRDDDIKNSDKFDHFCLQPRDVPGADQVQALTRAVENISPTAKDYQDAEVIVEWLFEEVLDKKKFFAHVQNSRRAAIHRQTRQQVIDGAYANIETAASVLSFAFLKPEFAKKPSVMDDGPSELKAQGVVSASDMQQAIFADVCDALTHAWARSQQPGKMSPVGMCEQEVEDFLATMESTVELDIEKQDSSHKPVHVIVASIFIEMCAEKMGLAQIALEIRAERRVRMMSTAFKFVLYYALASGDPWTLIINKIMAWSSLISVAYMKDVQTCQSGDDITMAQEPIWRDGGLKSQNMANKGLTWKVEERSQRREGVTFISRAVLPHNTVVYKALRTILKYAFRKRNGIQHAGIQADAKRIEALAARHGLQAYAEARAQVWGGDPVVIFDMWTRALAIANTPFASLDPALRSEEPRTYTVRERNGGCFGYALACCVKGNGQAINALAMYKSAVNTSTALRACEENSVPCVVMNESWAVRSKKRLIDAMDRRNINRSFVVVYRDHAVAIVPNTITVHSAMGKRTITWKSSMSKDVEITDFD